MPFIDDILKYKSLSIVGMEKNTGKTECLNYIINRLKDYNYKIAITSIGVDGETVDQVSNTQKPEIRLSENTVFVTSEKHYNERKLTSEIIDLSQRKTALGRLVTAKAKSSGKVVLSGPTSTIWLKELLQQMINLKIDIAIVDGALSRKSLGSPSVTQSMVLTTGAALSANIPNLVAKTKFTYSLINLDSFKSSLNEKLLSIESGLWAINTEKAEIIDLNIPSSFLLEKHKEKLFENGNTIFASGVIGDKILNFLRIQKDIVKTVLIVKDFTKIFASQEAYNAYIAKGGKIQVLLKTKLIAVCVNPVSPEGYVLDSENLVNALEKEINIPVYDIRKL